MIEIKLPPGLVRVVRGHEVDQLSGYGWKLVAMTTDEVPIELKKKEKEKDRQGYPSIYSMLTEIASEEAKGAVTLFVMMKDETSTIGSMQSQIDSLEYQLSDLLKKHGDIVNEAEISKKSIEERDRKISHLNEMYQIADKDRNELIRRMNSIESDLGKVREAIGNNKMKEILGK